MRHPFWIINSSLLFLLLVSVGFVLFSSPAIPKPRTIKKKSSVTKDTTASLAQITVSDIYKNDLFDTYHEKIVQPSEPDYAKPIPQPPSPSAVQIPEEPKQPFLPPLDITLKGIMLVDDDSMSIAVIADNKTKKDENYKIGDPLEDAQVVRIGMNKVVLIRSNGQQETLYLTEKDVLTDPAFSAEQDDWIHVIKKLGDNHFLLDPEAFATIVPNLAHFIDMFDLTTVYKEGKSIGCRVGKIAQNSLGSAMGLQSYTIIKKIADTPATTTDERLNIYDKLMALEMGASFSVEVSLDGNDTTLNFSLHDLKDPFKEDKKQKNSNQEDEKTGILQGPSSEELEKERIALLEERYKFAPTTQEIMIQQKEAMLKEGKQGRLNDFSLSNQA